MGIRQEHGKVLKLQVAQSLFGLIPHNERQDYEESFESVCRSIMGEHWDKSGLSMESAEGLGYYLRGVASASGKPITHNHRKVMHVLARDVLSLESRASGWDNGTLAGAMALNSLEGDASRLLKRYGLEQLSTEGFAVNAVKSIGTILANMFKGKEKKPGTQKIETQFDARNVDYSQVHKMADYIDECFLKGKGAEDWTPTTKTKISGENIVKNLTWGHTFDQTNPLTFQKKKFAEWDKFYHAHEAAVVRMSSAIMADEKTTRAAINEAREDDDKMEKIIDKACAALLKLENPADVAAKMKPDFPGGQTTKIFKRGEFDYDNCDTAADPAFKDIAEIRPLKEDEAKALLAWIRDRIRELKTYTTVFDKAKWSDHSDGDAIWEQAEHISGIDTYAGLIYWQNCENDFMEMEDISTILAHLSNGIINWVIRSFE